jgi:signal transduction histidine kinase
MDLGADDYITKPFEVSEILSAVRSRLARRNRLEERFEARLSEFRHNLATTLPHEFRTPLAGILGYSEILLEQPDQVGPDELRRAATTIHASGQRLLRCVESFLLYAELESLRALGSGTTPVQEQTDLIACLERAVTSRAKLHRRESDVRLSIQPACVPMPEAYLLHVLNEVLDNAFRHSPRETTVEIACTLAGRTVSLTVTNQGRALTPEQIERIEAFVQFDRQRHEQQGLGLGLAISRRLVERFGGRLEIRSSPGGETMISIALPNAAELPGERGTDSERYAA